MVIFASMKLSQEAIQHAHGFLHANQLFFGHIIISNEETLSLHPLFISFLLGSLLNSPHAI